VKERILNCRKKNAFLNITIFVMAKEEYLALAMERYEELE
jgi:hypothetical protein